MTSPLGVVFGMTFDDDAIGGDVARRSAGDPAGLPDGSSTAEQEPATHAIAADASNKINAIFAPIRYVSAITGYNQAHHRPDLQDRCSGSREGCQRSTAIGRNTFQRKDPYTSS